MTHQLHCYDIHHTLAIDYINGQISIGPCCQSGRIRVDNNDLIDLWNHPKLQNLRLENLQGKLSDEFCSVCIKGESRGYKSRRIDTQEFYQDWNPVGKTIRSLDIQLGNLCNLKCSICGPASSTAWIPDAKKMGIPLLTSSFYDKQYYNTLSLESRDSSLLSNLEMIKFWGGEPLLNETHCDILEFLDQIGVLKNCRVIYNTNGTRRVSDRVLDCWGKANLVELYFSIDDIGSRFEYQRFGAKWSEVTENLNWYRDRLAPNHLFYLMCTVSHYNIAYLDELVEWHNTHFNLNKMGDPVRICLQKAIGRTEIKFLSTSMYQYLCEKFKHHDILLDFLKVFPIEDSRSSAKEFIDYADKLDSIRGTNRVETFKEIQPFYT